ncbi:MAG TPA: protein kinase [Polyangium sp.]|nr:protein kinase [Polyangium sp.]
MVDSLTHRSSANPAAPGSDAEAPREDGPRKSIPTNSAQVLSSMAMGPTMPEGPKSVSRGVNDTESQEIYCGGHPIGAGTVVKHYEIIRKLGSGGMGTVFLARDTRLGRLVAIKFLLAAEDTQSRSVLSEARMTAHCRHENIVVIYDVDALDGYPYLETYPYMVLEYVEGQTLRAILERRERQTPHRVMELMLPVVRALGCAHEMGIIHRDLKPENILLSTSGQIKVLDFGIAKQMNQGLPRAPSDTTSPHEQGGMNHQTALSGTMPYMSPEQWLGAVLDGRTDIWAVGIIMYELVSGEHPLEPVTLMQLAKVVDASVPMPSLRQACPDAGPLAEIVDRCLLKNRDDRYASIAELQSALEKLQSRPNESLPVVDDASPFAGLSAFQEADARRFFGRDRDIAMVVGKLRQQQLVSIAGPSGAGKSSFVRAGVIPALKQAGKVLETFVVRPGRRPLSALADVLAFMSDSSAEAGDDVNAIVETLRTQPGYLGARLRSRCRRRGAEHRIVLFVDQLEELHTLGIDPAERAAFCACIEGVADDASSPLRVIVTIRADFLDRLSSDRRFMEEVTRGLVFLPPLGREGLLDALVKPLQNVRYKFEDEQLCSEMLADLEGTKSPLPLLQFTATKLWELRDTEARILTRQSYRALGGIAGALSAHADAVIEGFAAPEQRLVRSILMRLVTPERTRAIVQMGELHALDADTSKVDSIIDRLAVARLVSIESSDDQAGKIIELTHESLIERWSKLRQWLDENEQDAQFLAQLRTAATQWEKNDEAEGLLWRDRAAIEAGQWLERRQSSPTESQTTSLGPREERFLHAVIRYSERTRRWRRRIAVGAVGALAVVAIVVSTLAVRAREEAAAAQRARENAERAMGEAKKRAVEASDARQLAGYRELALTGQRRWAAKLLSAVQNPGDARGWLEMANDALQGYEAIKNSDGTPRLRYDSSGHEVTLRGANKSLECLSWSNKGKWIVAGSVDGTVHVWDASGRGDPRVFSGHRGPVRSVEFNRDDTHFVTASEDGTARIWQLDGAAEPVIIDVRAGPLRAASWSPNGDRLLTSSIRDDVRIWKADGHEVASLKGHKADITSATFFSGGKRVLTTSKDKTARIWTSDGAVEFEFKDHDEAVVFGVPSPDGSLILTVSADKTARIWSTAKNSKTIVLEGHRGEVVHGAWHPDGTKVATASGDGTARVWTLDRPDNPAVLAAHSAPLTNVSFRADGKYVVTASRDESTMVWPTEGGEALVLPGNRMWFSGAAFSPDGMRILTAGSAEEGAQRGQTATIWRLRSLESLARDRAPVAHSVRLDALSKFAFVAYDDHAVRSWSLDGQDERVLFESPGTWISSATPNHDGSRVAVALFNNTAKIITVHGNAQPIVLTGHSGIVRNCVWSPDGTRLVTLGDEPMARLHTLETTSSSNVGLSGHTDALTSASWSHDGKKIVTTSMDHTARVWSVETPSESIVLQGHAARVMGSSWLNDHRTVVTVSEDGTAQSWDTTTGSPLMIWNVGKPLARVETSRNGLWLAFALRDGGFEVWRADGRGDAILRVKGESVLAMAFIDEDRRILTVGAQRGARIFSINPERLTHEIESRNQDCLPADMRVTYLGELPNTAHEHYVNCEKEHDRTPATSEQGP